MGHVGVRRVLDRLFDAVGLDVAWAVAVHPYDSGDPRVDELPATGMYARDGARHVARMQPICNRAVLRLNKPLERQDFSTVCYQRCTLPREGGGGRWVHVCHGALTSTSISICASVVLLLRYTFASLPALGAYLEGRVAALGGDPNIAAAASGGGRGASGVESGGVAVWGKVPQATLYASEQGWCESCNGCDDGCRARNICAAHDLSERSGNVIGVTHNTFQETGGSQGGNYYGLVSQASGDDLASGASSPEFLAYNATAPHAWRVDPSNYCCASWGTGCP